MRTQVGISASRVPVVLVWTSEPLRCQYSAALCVCITFGNSRGSSSLIRFRMPSPFSGFRGFFIMACQDLTSSP